MKTNFFKIGGVFFFVFTFLFISCENEELEVSATQGTPETAESGEVIDEPLEEIPISDLSSLEFIGKNSSGFTSKAPSKDVPIIFVHGLLGWGEDEVLGLPYWGMFTDPVQAINDSGYRAHAVGVGPITSAHDRAVELYYQIKGGCIDYGYAHSLEHGHLRFVNKCYDGIYPEWDENHPIHLIGHSFGANTIRLLEHYLNNGSPSEIAAEASEISPLFEGGHHGWVKSITSVAGANNGSTAATILLNFEELIVDMFTGAATLIGSNSSLNSIYDSDLDQWGIARHPGESLESYLRRAMDSGFNRTKDYAGFDLSPYGSKLLNDLIEESSDTYYFSINCQTTVRGILTGRHYPRLRTWPPIQPTALGMGRLIGEDNGVVLDRTWWPSDGLANVTSQVGPHDAELVEVAWPPKKGKWNYFPTFQGIDHMDIIGWDPLIPVDDFYLDLANFLTSLD